jgi:RNA recognition motif-containing protein
MGDPSTPKDNESVSMKNLGDALPPTSLTIANPPTISSPQSLYQHSFLGVQAAPIYGPTYAESPPYYQYAVPGQQHLDPSQTGYAYSGQIWYRSTPVSPVQSPIAVPQYAQGTMRPGSQPQGYNLPRYQYVEQYSPAGRSLSLPAYPTSSSVRANPRVTYSPPNMQPMFTMPFNQQAQFQASYSDESSSATPDPENSFPRGPPRKPKQSGFALWVGNLPRDVLLEELKEFFALDGLESIFLIRKSNCAFVNYKTEEACSIALSMFNDKSISSFGLFSNRGSV